MGGVAEAMFMQLMKEMMIKAKSWGLKMTPRGFFEYKIDIPLVVSKKHYSTNEWMYSVGIDVVWFTATLVLYADQTYIALRSRVACCLINW